MEGRDGTAAAKADDTAQDAPTPGIDASNISTKPKVSLSLGKKKKKKTGTSCASTNADTSEHFATSTSALAQESQDASKTIADRAVEVAKARTEELVIPCVGGGGGAGAAGGRTRPLLAGRAQALRAEAGDGGEGGQGQVDAAASNNCTIKAEEVVVKPDPDAGGNNNVKDDDDAAAAEALIRSSTDRSSHRAAGGAVGDTNFAARGDLVIKKEENTNELMAQAMKRGGSGRGGGARQQHQDDETQEFRRDLARQADDLDVESEAYAAVPISEFGAAMLRGMGWTGGGDGNATKGGAKKKDGDNDDGDGMMKPRHHRLGLGAAPRPVSLSGKDGTATIPKPGGRHRALRPHEVERAEQEKRDEEEFHRRAAERARLDKQRTVQVGSVVRVRNGDGVTSKKRAIMVKTSGVPGLNQVLIRYEGTTEDVSVRKSDAILVEQSELDENPFSDAGISADSKGKSKARRDRSEEEKKESGSSGDRRKSSRSADHYDDDSRRRSSSDRERKRDRYDDDRDSRRDRDRYDEDRRDRKKSRSSRDDERRRSSREEERDRDRSRRRDRDDDRHELSRDRKRSKKDRSDRYDGDRRSIEYRRSDPCPSSTLGESMRWLTPNIRVRVITKKLAKGRQYKEKGVVLDVLPGGAHATVQMTDGEVLDKVPERYLETALPKVGGNAIVLAGDARHRFAKGRLLERDSSKGRAAVQLFEEMNILNLSLDDIAEWCGPLDSDMMS